MLKLFKEKNIYKMFKGLIFLLVLSSIILFSVSTPGYAWEDYGFDMYGLRIRNSGSSLPSWYPEDVSVFPGFHDEQIPRVVDMAGILTHDEKDALKTSIAEISSQIGRDIVVVTDIKDYGLGHEKYCYDFYDFNGYGIGDGYEGLCLFVCMDPDNRGWWVGATGYETRSIYTESKANELDDILYNYFVSGLYYQGINTWVQNVKLAYKSFIPPDPATLPPWYPEDPNSFVSFHDSVCSRVVDFAKILEYDEEEELKKKIRNISAKVGKDIVIVTDNDEYGLGHEKYCYDFYDYNGYGIGKDYEGICLFICMDPSYRGWWTGATGDISRSLYTEENANVLDDALYDYLSEGKYAEGISDWLDHIYNLYTKGLPLAPEWYPDLEEKENYVRTHNPNAPRVYESLQGDGVFTVEQEEALTRKAQSISEKYGVDVVIHTTRSDCGLGYERYVGDYYYYNGYGLGEDYNVILFCIFDKFNKITIDTYGKIKDELSGVNYTRMLEQSQDELDYYKAADVFLDNVKHFERTGRVSRTFGQWLFAAILSSIVGFFFGKKALNKAKKNMVTVRCAYGADNYVAGASDFATGTEKFVTRNVSRVYIQPKPTYTSSSSSSSRSHSSGGRSTYHSSSRGSSGRSHSGSGRRF